MKVTIKTNGYEAKGIQKMISVFNKAVEKLFWQNEVEVEHFYYGDKISMCTVRLLHTGQYGDFNISENRISFNGHTCTRTTYKKFEQLTYNDELHESKLFKIV